MPEPPSHVLTRKPPKSHTIFNLTNQGKLENGEEFDNSITRGEPIEFQLGAQQVGSGARASRAGGGRCSIGWGWCGKLVTVTWAQVAPSTSVGTCLVLQLVVCVSVWWVGCGFPGQGGHVGAPTGFQQGLIKPGRSPVYGTRGGFRDTGTYTASCGRLRQGHTAPRHKGLHVRGPR